MKALLLIVALLLVQGCGIIHAIEPAPDSPSESYTPLLHRGQVAEFMLADNTSDNAYTTGMTRYTCGYFARDVVLNARAQGIEAYRVIITWEDSWSHAIVVFPTIFSGDVYVDATQGDWWVEMRDGRYYSWSMTDENFHSWYDMPIDNYFIDERL